MESPAELERRALQQLRAGDLEGARGSLTLLLQHRPHDGRLRQRIARIDEHIESQSGGGDAEALRWARGYVEAGRLAEALQLLRDALADDPNNRSLREFALQTAARLRAERNAAAAPTPAAQARPEPQSRAAPVVLGDVDAPAPAATETRARPEAKTQPAPRTSEAGHAAAPTGAAPRALPARPHAGGPVPRLTALLAQIRARRRPSGGLTQSPASPRP